MSDSPQKLEGKMFMEISGEIAPSVQIVWEQFKSQLETNHLPPAEVGTIENFFNAMTLLARKGVISLGNYANLRDLFETMKHAKVCAIIDNYTSKMNAIGTAKHGQAAARGAPQTNQGIQGTTGLIF